MTLRKRVESLNTGNPAEPQARLIDFGMPPEELERLREIHGDRLTVVRLVDGEFPPDHPRFKEQAAPTPRPRPIPTVEPCAAPPKTPKTRPNQRITRECGREWVPRKRRDDF